MKISPLNVTAALVALSVAAPVLAYTAPADTVKLSRRLVRSEAILNQRIPSGAMAVDLLLRERKAAQKDATGRADLSRSQIQSRIRTLRGGTPDVRQYWKVDRPSRRSVIQNAEERSMLILPPSLVQTGESAVMVSHVSRRTLRVQTEQANVVRVLAAQGK